MLCIFVYKVNKKMMGIPQEPVLETPVLDSNSSSNSKTMFGQEAVLYGGEALCKQEKEV